MFLLIQIVRSFSGLLNFLIINSHIFFLAAKVDVTVKKLNGSRSNFAIRETVKIWIYPTRFNFVFSTYPFYF